MICKLHKNYVCKAIRGKHNLGEYSLIRITLKERCHIFTTVSQLNQRWVRRNQEYEPSFVRMIFARVLDENEEDQHQFPYEYIEGKGWKDEDTTIEGDGEPGEYLAYVEIHWIDEKLFNNFVFRTYSSATPELEEVKEEDYPNFLNYTLKSGARKSNSKKIYTEKAEPDIYRSFSITESKAEYGFLYYENNSERTILREGVKFGELENLKIMDEQSDECKITEKDSIYSVEVEVPPGENRIVLLNRVERGCSFNCTYYTSMIKPIDDALEVIESKGNKNQIEHNSIQYNIFYYILKDGSGYVWYFKNEDPVIIFEGTFYFKLENLFILGEEEGTTEWKVKLQPQETAVMKLMMKDLTQSWGYKYSYSFKCKENIRNNEMLLKKVKNCGTK